SAREASRLQSAKPLRSAAVPAFSVRSSGRADEARPPIAAEPSFGMHAGILVVDDQPSIRTLLSELFGAFGADVYAAENGGAALNLMKRHTIDCVLLDLKLPDMSGIEVLRGIRMLHQDVPVLLISAYIDPIQMEEA